MTEQTLTDRQRQILEIIDESMRDRGYPPSVREIGEAVGLTSPSTVHSHLNTLSKLGFLERDPTKPRAIEVRYDPNSGAVLERRPARHVPLVGDVAAGTDVLAQENVEEILPLPADFTGDGDLFMLRVRGESMIDAGILDGDFVVARAQPTADKGDIVVAGLPGEEATVKTYTRKGGQGPPDAVQPDDAADRARRRPMSRSTARSSPCCATCQSARAAQTHRRHQVVEHGPAIVELLPCDAFVAGVGEQRVAGAEVDRGNATAREPCDIRPSELGADLELVAGRQCVEERMVEPGARRWGCVFDRDLVAVLEHRRQQRAQPCLGRGLVAIRSESVVQHHARLVGHDVGRHSPLHHDRLQRLAVAAPVDDGLATRPAVDDGEKASEPVNGVAAHPRPGAVRRERPRSRTATRIVPWQPASSTAVVGSPRMAASPTTRSGRSRSRWPRPLCSDAISSAA